MLNAARSPSCSPAAKSQTAPGAALLEHLPDCSSILHADNGYDADAIRRQAEEPGAMPNIPPKANRKWDNCFSPFLYRNLNAIEHLAIDGFSERRQGRTVTCGWRGHRTSEVYSPTDNVKTIGSGLVKVGRLYKRLRWQGAARFINDELPCNLVHREPPIPKVRKILHVIRNSRFTMLSWLHAKYS
jgi:hypothetical protein